jgi:DNA-binding NarL/FixJ family response regulator
MLVDDHDLIRESWKELLDKDERFEVIAQCDNGTEAFEKAKQLLPDIVLMDVNMTPVNGFDATQRISDHLPTVKVIGVSINNNPKYALKMVSHGAHGFVTKTSIFTELKAAIEKVYAGETYICKEIRKKLPTEE